MLGPRRQISPSWPEGSSCVEDMILMLIDGTGLPTEPQGSSQSFQL
jgi:hypothetical protein